MNGGVNERPATAITCLFFASRVPSIAVQANKDPARGAALGKETPMVKGWVLRPGAFVAAVFLFALGTAAPVSAQQCGPTDVVFIIDNSGSMANVIANIQAEVSEIADAVEAASGGDYQFGLLAL